MPEELFPKQDSNEVLPVPVFSWCTTAIMPMILAGAAVYFCIGIFADAVRQAPATGILWLGTLPLLAAGTAVLLVLQKHLPAGRRLSGLHLEQAGCSLWPLFKIVCRRLVPVWPAAILLGAAGAGACRLLQLPIQSHPVLEAAINSPSTGLWISILILTMIAAPLLEEILFRLVIFESLRHHGERYATWISAAVFAAIHQMPAQFPALLFLGITLQNLRRQQQSLWAAILMHSAFNGLSLLLFTLLRPLQENLLQ